MAQKSAPFIKGGKEKMGKIFSAEEQQKEAIKMVYQSEKNIERLLNQFTKVKRAKVVSTGGIVEVCGVDFRNKVVETEKGWYDPQELEPTLYVWQLPQYDPLWKEA